MRFLEHCFFVSKEAQREIQRMKFDWDEVEELDRDINAAIKNEGCRILGIA